MHVIAVTSHPGAYDSEAQSFDNDDITFALCSPEQIADGLCGAEWHTHLVEPVDHDRCGFKAIGALTFEEPSEKVKIKAKKIILKEIEMETDDYTNSITGEVKDFTAGNPVDANPDTKKFDGAAFDLNATFDASGNLEAVCIGPVIPLETPPGTIPPGR
ncbi:MAG: hypothetical protein ACE5GR_05730 [Nitrosopumilus sp.]